MSLLLNDILDIANTFTKLSRIHFKINCVQVGEGSGGESDRGILAGAVSSKRSKTPKQKHDLLTYPSTNRESLSTIRSIIRIFRTKKNYFVS